MRILRSSTVLVGAAILVYGIYGFLTAPEITDRVDVGTWLAGGVLLHDLVLAPVVFVLCWAVSGLAPPRVRVTAAAILMIVGTALLVAAPILLHGRVAIR